MTTPIQGQQFDPDEEKILAGMTEHWRKVWNEAPAGAWNQRFASLPPSNNSNFPHLLIE